MLNGRDGTVVIVGFDRPCQEFFAQIWRDDEMEMAEGGIGLDELEQLAEIPPKLQELLILEVQGLSETNVCRDWRAQQNREMN